MEQSSVADRSPLGRGILTGVILVFGWTVIGLPSAHIDLAGDAPRKALELAEGEVYRVHLLDAWYWAAVTLLALAPVRLGTGCASPPWPWASSRYRCLPE